jgi:dihydrofolate reductase
MGEVVAAITTSVDGYVAGPDDGPGRGLGTGGERLHYWVFGGPWSYDEQPTGEATGADRELLDETYAKLGAVIGGRGTYDAAEAWGGRNPWAVPFYIVTHRTDERPPTQDQFTFVNGLDAAMTHAQQAAGDKQVLVMGGADLIRQALAGGYVDELVLTIAPVVLGAGKRLFEGFDKSIGLRQVGAVQSQWATHLRYRTQRDQATHPVRSGAVR